jgi:glycosyltransferase involved in cell wall biosynthesis
MKKNLLFVMPSLDAGGGEKSLVNLLNQIDYNLYNVDLFLFNPKGLFLEFIPKEVNLLSLQESYNLFTLPLFKSVKKLLLNKKLRLALNRMMFSIKYRWVQNISRREQYNWKYIAKSLIKLEKKYDVAIGFLEKTSIYFCVDKVDAIKKIGWIHNDYDELGLDPNIDIMYLKKLSKIITVSEECASVLKNRFPTEKDKVVVVYNIVSPAMINRMANIENKDIYHRNGNEFIILTIGRLHYQKGFEIAIDACKKLIDRGYNIKWNIIGEGEKRESLTKLIKANNLEDRFILLGLKSNPYPYLKHADIYAQTSRFEGKSIAIDEAKILKKPIIVTNFSTAKDQINDGKDGLIVNMNPDSVATGIEQLIEDIELRKRFYLNLSKLKLGTEAEIEKIYELCN